MLSIAAARDRVELCKAAFDAAKRAVREHGYAEPFGSAARFVSDQNMQMAREDLRAANAALYRLEHP